MTKRIIIFSLLTFSLISCRYNANLSQNINSIQVVKQVENKEVSQIENLKSVGVKEFKKELEKGDSILIDLRTPEELKQGIIPGVKLNLDYYSKDFINKLKVLDKNKKYLIYCRSGHRSGNILLLMKKFGFKNVLNLENGIISWVNSGEKLESFEEKK